MATTKIWDIKGRVDTLINYAANPEKTDGKIYNEKQIQALHDVMNYASDDYKTERSLYVSGVNTTPDTAKKKMHQTKLRYGKTDGIVAFHAIQSFKPGEVTPEIAHEIGRKLAKEMWGDRFEVVIATHLNKEHLHNHFVINSVSFVDGKKCYDNTANYNLMKKISDRLCEEYNLSVIQNPKSKGKHYAEWLAEKNGYPTIRGQIKDELDGIIQGSYTYQSFWMELKRRGYEIKDTGKYIALKPTFSEKYIRLKSLGENYSPEAIKERIIRARNGIKDLDRPKPDYNAWLKKYEPIKLKGFKALYYRYLYLFGKIRKKEPPQRVCFYLREELIKFERYQKQFHFLYDNDIETSGQLIEMKQTAEDRISELTLQRSRLYHKPDAKSEIADINTELKKLRAKFRMCNNILTDSERIAERYNEAQRLEQEATTPQKYKKKDKNDEHTR
ncbi:MAG: relaxase/mobilization nuclease domain-containing protein [Clostridia bacterium]|nr:relaxase/mobilization nuclease domain-containing protein [Clostridia bacterium]